MSKKIKQKKYWLVILPHIYYVQKNKQGLVYNTQTGEYMQIHSKKILNLLEQMHEKTNLGVICIGETILEQTEINVFIKESVLKNIFIITQMIEGQPKPIHLMPVLNLQREVEKLKKEEGRTLGENIFHYLSDITIYLNNSCVFDCAGCGDYFNQFFHCSKSFNTENIDFDLLKRFFKHLTISYIRRLAITGGNIFLYPYFSELINFLHKEKIFSIFGIHYRNIDMKKIKLLNDFAIELFVTFPIEEKFVKKIISLSKQNNTTIIFIISSEEDYRKAEIIISQYILKNYSIRPFFNGENHTFFKNNVYLTKEDILRTTISQRKIFSRQKLNTNFFGRIHLFPNGDIKAHPFKEVIDNCQQELLVKIIEKELITNTAWRIVRDKEPCNNCIYQYLCPSPSEYEWVINKNNLCTVIP